MKPARKRKIIQEIGTKQIENANLIVLKYLKMNKNSKFGDLFSHVNSELGEKNQYSRKGFSLRLGKLINEGKVARLSYKQGHFLYYLTKKGEENIELVSEIFSNFSYQLLKANFIKKETKVNKEYYVRRIVERIGTYMLFSYIHGLSKYTSPEKNFKTNTTNMKQWENGINPSFSLGRFLDDVMRDFLKYDNDLDMIFIRPFKKKSFYKILNDFQKILEEKFPEECKFLKTSSKWLEWEMENKKFEKRTKNEQQKIIRKKVNKTL